MKISAYLNTRNCTLQHMVKYDPVICRWIMRMLMPAGLHQKFIDRLGVFADDDVLNLIGLEELDGGDLSRSRTCKVIQTQWKALESDGDLEVEDGPLEQNIQQLQKKLGLSDLECEILHFIILLKGSSVLDETADLAGEVNTEQATQIIAIVLKSSRQYTYFSKK